MNRRPPHEPDEFYHILAVAGAVIILLAALALQNLAGLPR